MTEQRVTLEFLDDRSHPVVAAHAQIVPLGDVVGQYHPRARTQPGEHGQQHVSLQRLCLVDDDERIVQRAAANVRQWQHLQHAAGEHLLKHRGAGEALEGVEHRLRPRAHLLALTARQVTQFLAADGIERAEHHDLALGAPLQHRL